MAGSDVLMNICYAIYEKFSLPSNIETLMAIGDQPVGGVGPVAAQEPIYNDFFTSVNGQLFENKAPEGTEYPYAVYAIVAAPKDKTFTEEYTNTLIQFSLYSSNMDSTEIKNMYLSLRELFHDCELVVTGSTFIWMLKEGLITDIEEETTPEGTRKVRVYHVDFDVLTCLD